MILSDKAVDDTKNLAEFYTDLNEYFYKYLFDILKQGYSDILPTRLEFINTGNVGALCYSNKKECIIMVNTDILNRRCYKLAQELCNNPELSIELTKYVSILIIIHEFFHVEQTTFNYEYPEINRLYQILNTERVKNKLIYRFFYFFKGADFCFERYANINALEELCRIVPKKFFEEIATQYIYNILEGYNFNKKLSISARETFKMIHEKYDIESDGIPADVRIYHGLDITEDEYDYYIRYFDESEEINYNEFIKRYGR